MGDLTNPTKILHHVGSACLTIQQLADQLQLTTVQVSRAAAGLVARDLLERAERGCFRLTEAGLAAKREGVEIKSGPAGIVSRDIRRAAGQGLRQRAWNAMSVTKGAFTVGDLLIAAARGEEGDAEDNLQRFCAILAKAGYLRRLPDRDFTGAKPTSNGRVRYRLEKHTGPLAPVHRARARAVFDHNTREEVAL